jgi:hypothetical protein
MTMTRLLALLLLGASFDDGLELHFGFEEGRGMRAEDSSGNGIVGRLRRGTAWTEGKNGGGLRFDGRNDSVDLGHHLPLLRRAGAATLAAWVNPASLPPAGSSRVIVAVGTGAILPWSRSRADLRLEGGGIAAGGCSTDREAYRGVASGPAGLAPGVWSHVAAVVDYAGGEVRLYVDGSPVAAGPVPFGSFETPNTFARAGAVGSEEWGRSGFFHGVLDDVRVYGRALTDADIAALAGTGGSLQAPAVVSPSGVVATSSPAVSGTSSAPGLSITLMVDGVAAATTTSGVGGAWSAVPSSPLADGLHALTASASDGVLTSPESLPLMVTVDTQPPAVGVVSPPDGAVVPAGPVAVAGSWSDGGSGLDLATAEVRLDGVLVAAPGVHAGGFSFNAVLAAGVHGVDARIRDAAGNLGARSWSFMAEAAPPVAPPAPSISSPVANAFLSTASPTVSGSSSEAGLTITLLVDGAPRGTALSGAGGVWALVPSSPLSDGPHTLSATASNASGTSPPSASVPVTVDTIAPVVSGLSPSGGYVTEPSPTLSADILEGGSGFVANGVTVTMNAIVLPSTLASLGNGAWRVTASVPLGEGQHGFSVGAVDRALNASAPVSASFTVDLGPPAIVIASPVDGGSASGTVPLQATATDGVSGVGGVQVLLNGAPFAATLTPIAGGFSVTGTLPVQPGANTLEVHATDAAGRAAARAVSFTGEESGIVVISISPDRAGPGAQVRIVGTGLAGSEPTRVVFSSGVEVTEFLSLSPVEIVLRVPGSAVTGPVQVQVGAASSNPVPFEVVHIYAEPLVESLLGVDDEGYPVFPVNDLSVRLRADLGPSDADAIAAGVGGRVAGYVPGINLFVFRFDVTTLSEILAKRDLVAGLAGVVSVSLHLGLAPQGSPGQDWSEDVANRYRSALGDGRTGFWAYDRVQAPGAWSMLRAGSRSPQGVKVGIFEYGLDFIQDDFMQAGAPDVRTVTNSLEDIEYGQDGHLRQDGHGTAVGGIIAAGLEGAGVAGIASGPHADKGVPYSLYVLSARRLVTPDKKPRLMAQDLAAALFKCSFKGIRVLNVSMGRELEEIDRLLASLDPSLTAGARAQRAAELMETELAMFRDAVQMNPNVLVVVCAGNRGKNLATEASAYGSANARGPRLPNLIVVGGIGYDDDRFKGVNGVGASSYAHPPSFGGGPIIDLAAPAERVMAPWSTVDSYQGFVVQFPEPVGLPNSKVIVADGTSGAAAFVTGAAALIFSYDPSRSPASVKGILTGFGHRTWVDVGGARAEWTTLKIGNTMKAYMATFGEDEDWSTVFAPRAELVGNQYRLGIARTRKLDYDQGTYKAQEIPFLVDNFEEFSPSPSGRALFMPHANQNRDVIKLRSYALKDLAVTDHFTPNAGQITCSNVSVVRDVVDYPVALPNGDVVFLSRMDTECDDKAPWDFYLYSQGTVTRLTQIGKNTDVFWIQSGGIAGGQIPTPMDIRHFTVTADGRWVLFTNNHFDDTGRIYMFPIKDGPSQIDPKNPTYGSAGVIVNAGTHRFLASPFGKAAKPAVSPDGTRVAFIDRETRNIKISSFEVMPGMDDPWVRPWTSTEILTLPVQSEPNFLMLAWSPDGSHLLYTDAAGGGGTKVWVISTGRGSWTGGAPAPQGSVLIDVPGNGTGSFRPLGWTWRAP